MGFGVWGLGFGVWGLGFGVWGLGVGGWGFGVWGLGFGVTILYLVAEYPGPFQIAVGLYIPKKGIRLSTQLLGIGLWVLEGLK